MAVSKITIIESSVPILITITSIIGIVLCVLVLYLMFTKNVKGMFSMYIGNLIVADILIAVFYIFIGYFFQFYINQQLSDPLYCMIYESLHYHAIRAFVPLSLLPASIHRICCVLFPVFSYKWYNVKKLAVFCFIVDAIVFYYGLETWFRKTSYYNNKELTMSWCNFSRKFWIGDTGFQALRDAIDFSETSMLQSNYFPIIWAVILLMNFITVYKAIQSQKAVAGNIQKLARIKESYHVALVTILQVIVPLLNTVVGYLPNILANYYTSHGWVMTQDFLQTLYHISYCGIFLISMNPLCDALMVLVMMPQFRKEMIKLIGEKWKIEWSNIWKSSRERNAVVAIKIPAN